MTFLSKLTATFNDMASNADVTKPVPSNTIVAAIGSAEIVARCIRVEPPALVC